MWRFRIARDTVLWRVDAEKAGVKERAFQCHASAAAVLAVAEAGVDGADVVMQAEPLAAPEDDEAVQAAWERFPHLRGCTALRLTDPPSDAALAALVQSQLCMCAVDDGVVNSATGVQIQGVLDSECAPQCPPCHVSCCCAAQQPWRGGVVCPHMHAWFRNVGRILDSRLQPALHPITVLGDCDAWSAIVTPPRHTHHSMMAVCQYTAYSELAIRVCAACAGSTMRGPLETRRGR